MIFHSPPLEVLDVVRLALDRFREPLRDWAWAVGSIGRALSQSAKRTISERFIKCASCHCYSVHSSFAGARARDGSPIVARGSMVAALAISKGRARRCCDLGQACPRDA